MTTIETGQNKIERLQLSKGAIAVLAFSKAAGHYFGLKENNVTQELLDAGLIERTTYLGNRRSFRTTEAGKAWRPAS